MSGCCQQSTAGCNCSLTSGRCHYCLTPSLIPHYITPIARPPAHSFLPAHLSLTDSTQCITLFCWPPHSLFVHILLPYLSCCQQQLVSWTDCIPGNAPGSLQFENNSEAAGVRHAAAAPTSAAATTVMAAGSMVRQQLHAASLEMCCCCCCCRHPFRPATPTPTKKGA